MAGAEFVGPGEGAHVGGARWIDDLFQAFARSLPERLAEEARRLAVTLRLAPDVAVPWSEVFSHEVTLAAPALMAEAMPGASGRLVSDAVLAHLLAVVEAFGSDRIADGQIRPSGALGDLLVAVRRARDAAIHRVAPDADDPIVDFEHADRETRLATALERQLLQSDLPVTFSRYLAISLGKQRLGVPASVALAHAVGWDARRRRAVGRVLEDVALGLQVHDDVIDWEDDLRHGGAWAASLAGPTAGRAPLVDERRRVYSAGVLATMLDESRACFGRARRRARGLRLHRLAGWAGERETHVGILFRGERASPGYANRAHALSVWARAVLA